MSTCEGQPRLSNPCFPSVSAQVDAINNTVGAAVQHADITAMLGLLAHYSARVGPRLSARNAQHVQLLQRVLRALAATVAPGGNAPAKPGSRPAVVSQSIAPSAAWSSSRSTPTATPAAPSAPQHRSLTLLQFLYETEVCARVRACAAALRTCIRPPHNKVNYAWVGPTSSCLAVLPLSIAVG